MNKSWKVTVAVLSVIFIWQYTNLRVINPVRAQETLPPRMVEIKPTMTKEQQAHANYQKAKFLSVVNTNEKVSHTKADLLCLAKNIYHEAGNQPVIGKLAVAQVTINRTKDPKFLGGICDVVFANNQFSWTNSRKLKGSHPTGEQWEQSINVAREALDNGARIKGMEKVLYYHANYCHPKWKHVVRFTQIGAHIFYVKNA